MLAPIALVAFGIAALIILTTAGGSEHKESSGPTKAEQRDLRLKREQARQQARRQRAASVIVRRGVYVVRTGDTLGAIAQRTGVTVERLQELNPTLDPQALTSGQRIKLR